MGPTERPEREGAGDHRAEQRGERQGPGKRAGQDRQPVAGRRTALTTRKGSAAPGRDAERDADAASMRPRTA